MSTNIITDFQINNNLTITDNNLKIVTDGTTDTLDISGNVDVSNNLIIRGYIGIKTETPVVSIDINANDALRLPVGNNSSRPDYTTIDCSGCIRYNSETTQFEGFSPSGLSWIGLGGVVDIDQDTKILAELNPDEDKLRFYTAGGQQMLINESGNVGIGLDSDVDPVYILDINNNGAIRIPVGTTGERPTNATGLIRYNSTNNEFEGYGESSWGGLGGVKTSTGNTKITADDTNGLEFFTNNDEKMTILANGNVGIGTASPGIPLDVHGSYLGRYNNFGSLHNSDKRNSFYIGRWDGAGGLSDAFLGMELKVDTASNMGYGVYDNQTAIIFQTWGSNYATDREVMRIRGDGNVGIGTNEPNAKLHVNGNIKIKQISEIGNTSSNYDNGLIFEREIDNKNYSYYMGYAQSGWFSIGQYHPGTTPNHNEFFRANGNDVLLCPDGEGNVGIGTSSSTDLLTVGNNATTNTGGTTSMSILAPGENADAILYFGTQEQSNSSYAKKAAIIAEGITAHSRSKLHFCLDNTADNGSSNNASISNSRMTIQRDGNVGIGATSPDAKLDIEFAGKTGSLLRFGTDREWHFTNNYTGGSANLNLVSSTDNKSFHIKLDQTLRENAGTIKNTLLTCLVSTTNPYIRVTGKLEVTGDITAYYSDERLKTFKGKITEPLAKIKQINGYYFVENELAKSLGYDNDKLQVGVSAQEVEKVLPEIVTKAPIDNEYKTVWYQKLTPLLIEGMKEQQTQIEQQQTQIQSLQEQINELKALISK